MKNWILHPWHLLHELIIKKGLKFDFSFLGLKAGVHLVVQLFISRLFLLFSLAFLFWA